MNLYLYNLKQHMDASVFKRVIHVRLLMVLCVLGLNACSLPQAIEGDSKPNSEVRGRGIAGETSHVLHNDLIVGMLKQKQYYAALAHVQELQNQTSRTPELRYLEAEARRELGQSSAAEALYRGLLRSAYAADSYRGLGLLYVKTDLNLAVQQLQEAVRRRPTDARMRNDLGYALMMAGRYQEALPQLATAVELDPEQSQSLNNLILLLILTGDETGAKRVADQSDVSAEALRELRQQAQSLKAKRRK